MKTRSRAPEIMDDLQMEGPELRNTLKVLARINAFLGGDKVTSIGIKRALKGSTEKKGLHIVDLGCGEGSHLRMLARYSRKRGLEWKFTGVDANADCVNFARERSVDYPEIEYLQQDVFSWEAPECDLVIATLFMHHFSDEQIIELITHYKPKLKIGWVINDLHRSPLAYGLFWLLSLFMGNSMVRNDGLLSIKKGFKKKELYNLAIPNGFTSKVSWHWAFRFLWILKK